jgi:hypothetical protein
MSQMFGRGENGACTEFYWIYFCVLTKNYSTQKMKDICISQFYRAKFALQTMLSTLVFYLEAKTRNLLHYK